MSQYLSPLRSSAPSYLRYFAVLSLTAFIGHQLIVLLATDIISTQAAVPSEAREFSRVEMIMSAHEAAYIRLPTPPVDLPLPIEEPIKLASNLAIEMDRAEFD